MRQPARPQPQWVRAEAAATLGKLTWERLERLSRAVYDMALAGARSEDRDAAAAVVRQAQGAVSEVEAYLGETTLVAPRDGEVSARNVEPGELAAPGYPVVTLVDLSDAWVVFNLREDRLAGLKVGARLDARVPALGRELEPRRIATRRLEPLLLLVLPALALAFTWAIFSADVAAVGLPRRLCVAARGRATLTAGSFAPSPQHERNRRLPAPHGDGGAAPPRPFRVARSVGAGGRLLPASLARRAPIRAEAIGFSTDGAERLRAPPQLGVYQMGDV